MSSFNSYLYSLGIAELFLPDEYNLENNQLNIPNTFVLSRMKSGETLSVYADNVWDLSPYLPKCYCKLNFKTWLENAREGDFLFAQIRAEMKKVIFALLYVKTGKSIIKCIENRHIVLRQFAAIAYLNGCTLTQLFSNAAYIAKLNDIYTGISYHAASRIKDFLTDCFVIQQQYPLVIPAFSTYQPIEHLAKIAAQLRLQSGKVGPQTKVIPSRIYIALINSLAGQLDEFNQYALALKQWFQRTKQDANFALMPVEFKRAKRAISFADARDILGLTTLFEKHQIQKHVNLTSYITLIQGMAELWIHLFTGMRDNEVNQLSYNCYQKVKSNEHEIHVLVGYTSQYCCCFYVDVFASKALERVDIRMGWKYYNEDSTKHKFHQCFVLHLHQFEYLQS